MKSRSTIEIAKNQRTYQLILDHDSPLGECFDAIYDMQKYIIQLMTNVSDQMKETSQSKD